jgi:hypothetical protein
MSGHSCMPYGRYQHWGGFTFAVSANLDPTVRAIICTGTGYLRGSLHRRRIRRELPHPIGAFGNRVEQRSRMLDCGASIV